MKAHKASGKKPVTGRADAARPKTGGEDDTLPLTRLASQKRAGAKPFIGALFSDEVLGFAMVLGTLRISVPELRQGPLNTPVVENGELLSWYVLRLELSADRQTVLEESGHWLFKTEAESLAEFERLKTEMWAKPPQSGPTTLTLVPGELLNTHRAALPAAKGDLLDAQMKVLREQYPDTYRAYEASFGADEEARAEKEEELFRSFVVDSVRLLKDDTMHLEKGGAFHHLPYDSALISRLNKAHGAKSPLDVVDYELAVNWQAAKYWKMKPAEYTAKINAKLGTRLSVAAMKGRALTKLRLVSDRPEGRPANDGKLP